MKYIFKLQSEHILMIQLPYKRMQCYVSNRPNGYLDNFYNKHFSTKIQVNLTNIMGKHRLEFQ